MYPVCVYHDTVAGYQVSICLETVDVYPVCIYHETVDVYLSVYAMKQKRGTLSVFIMKQ